MLSLMLAACTGLNDTATTPERGDPIVLMTFNAGTTQGLGHDGDDNAYTQEMADIADALYENSLSWNPAEDALREHLAAVRPHVAVFQELFYDGWCADIDVDPALNFVCDGYTPDRPLQIARLLGEDYQIACAPGQPDNCAGIRRDFGRFLDGCPEDAVCLEGLDGSGPPSGCSRGARVGRIRAETVSGVPFTLVNVHGSSGVTGEDMDCRVDQFRQIFVDRGDGQPAADGTINLVMGDLNTDPFRMTGVDPSAVEWASFVGEGKDYRYISARDADDTTPSYQGFTHIDHIASDTLERDGTGCTVAPLWEGTYWDHLPVTCEASGL